MTTADDALLAAVASGDLAGVRAALAAGADPSATRSYWATWDRESIEGSESALLLAVRGGQAAIARALLGHGADPNASDRASGRTALIEAAAHGDAALVGELLAAGASPAARDGRDDLDAFATAVAGGHGAAARQLAAAGVVASARALEEACRRGRIDLAELCRESGQTARAARVLAATARAGQLAMVEWLVAQGIDLWREGPNALGEAANAGRADVVAWLARAGVPLDRHNSFGWTALHLAAYNADACTVQVLLDAGADPAVTDRAGNDAVHWAREAGKEQNALLVERAQAQRRG